MNKFYFGIISLKKNLISIITILFIIMLIIYSKSNIIAVKQGLELWVNNVVPSLFPFFIATEILVNTNIISVLGKILEKPFSKIFNAPGEGAFALVMGMICGYPSGAKIVTDLKSKGLLTLEEAERLVAFTNNSGPLFILGTVGISLLGNSHIGVILLISHFISCIIVGIVFRNWKSIAKGTEHLAIYENGEPLGIYNKNEKLELSQASKNFGEILSSAIRNSISTILNIGGFIVLFSVIISILNSSGFFKITGLMFEIMKIPFPLGNSVISGFIELTNGLKAMSLLQITKMNICLISFLIGFGGLSVLFQVYSIIVKEKISIKPYFYGKLLQGVISFFITWILVAH